MRRTEFSREITLASALAARGSISESERSRSVMCQLHHSASPRRRCSLVCAEELCVDKKVRITYEELCADKNVRITERGKRGDDSLVHCTV